MILRMMEQARMIICLRSTCVFPSIHPCFSFSEALGRQENWCVPYGDRREQQRCECVEDREENDLEAQRGMRPN
jgi:hypothetical protein